MRLSARQHLQSRRTRLPCDLGSGRCRASERPPTHYHLLIQRAWVADVATAREAYMQIALCKHERVCGIAQRPPDDSPPARLQPRSFSPTSLCDGRCTARSLPTRASERATNPPVARVDARAPLPRRQRNRKQRPPHLRHRQDRNLRHANTATRMYARDGAQHDSPTPASQRNPGVLFNNKNSYC